MSAPTIVYKIRKNRSIMQQKVTLFSQKGSVCSYIIFRQKRGGILRKTVNAERAEGPVTSKNGNQLEFLRSYQVSA